MVDILCYCI